MNRDAIPNHEAARYFFHFPDGNATLARLLVRGLIPAAIPGRSADDMVTARADYARLDEPGAPARIRPRQHGGARARTWAIRRAAREVEVDVRRGGDAADGARRSACVLACWTRVIPHLCPELPEAQKEALAYAVKVPDRVHERPPRGTGAPSRSSACDRVHCPGSYHTR